ncbi:EAL domain-containing protein [Neptuniibacter sp.]|uniref:EAL domain-containing protein n=1 Tax=Neptuniibacter sp. TaxID=1962643 RepID=UPI002615CEDF|nr:EAL domain-containing protein [Neptuniibacter sp.]MCP4595223.1 EAL domain-containing protein [Neptuniibacter sp.]
MIKRRFIQIAILAALLLLIAVGISSSVLKRFDLIIYDTLTSLNNKPAPEEIVIVAIDERSLASLGRWPWSREIHAQLLDQLSKAKVIGFDILFSEGESPLADSRFADAINQNGNVVLALAPEKDQQNNRIIELLPIPELAVNSAGIGHVDTELDIDGICRRIYLYAGLGDPNWPTLGLAIFNLFKQDEGLSPFAKPQTLQEGTGWVRSTPMLIPFYGPEGHFQQYSYADVLNGSITPETFADKVVLVGATAVGMGDAISTPVSGLHKRLPGVELNANITAALLQSRFIHQTSDLVQYALTAVLVLLLLPLTYYLPRRYFPLSLPLGIVISLGLSIVMFLKVSIWFAPAVTILMQILGFTYISWNRYYASLSKIQQLNKEVYERLNFDQLTHLPNREMLKDQLQLELNKAEKEKNKLALLVIQLSNIKEVNNRLGFAAGDKVLSMASSQIQKAVSHQYPVARLGGIEFAVMLPSQSDRSKVENIGSRLIQLLQLPCELEGEHFFFKPSIGVCLYPEDGHDSDTLMGNAYSAMHKAKKSRKRRLSFYSQEIKKQLLDQSSLERDLHLALSRNELELYYQPQVMSNSGQITGLEALLRWHHPERGMVRPDQFIPIAESTGLIIEIGNWVLDSACNRAMQWREQYQQDIRMAVNLSAIQFSESLIVESITNALRSSGLPPYLLELELTESVLMDDPKNAIELLQRMKQMGINIAIDDFGTGYSSLSYLKQFPLDRIKIDQSFVRDLEDSSESAEITQAIITMAHSLNLKVIAEGVETPQQRGFLLTQTCEELQGYYFSKPLPADKVTLLLQQNISTLK